MIICFPDSCPIFYTKKFLATFNEPVDNEMNVSLTLLSVLNHRMADINRMSFDLPNRRDLNVIKKQVELNPKPVFVMT